MWGNNAVIKVNNLVIISPWILKCLLSSVEMYFVFYLYFWVGDGKLDNAQYHYAGDQYAVYLIEKKNRK